MNTLLDSITIGIFGGKDVGKTTLLRRLLSPLSFDLNTEETSTKLIQGNLRLNCLNHLTISIKIVEVGSELIYTEASNTAAASVKSSSAAVESPGSFLSKTIQSMQAMIFVIDLTNKESVIQCHQWLEIVRSYKRDSGSSSGSPFFTYLLANKADLPTTHRILAERNLDKLKHRLHFIDWAYTVGDPSLGDVDIRRGNLLKQKCIEDVFQQLLLLVLGSREAKFYHFLKPPLSTALQPVSYHIITGEEIGSPIKR